MRALEFARSMAPAEYFECINTAFAPWGSNAERMSGELADWMRLASQGSRSPSVRIMTMDSAKGLEAGCVVLVGADEGILPASPLGGNGEPLESRKFFVAMTRAKRVLHICHSVNRSATCTLSGRTLGMRQSRFVNAIPQGYRTYENHL
jgi:superfamily I DNA/RNA helicase